MTNKCGKMAKIDGRIIGSSRRRPGSSYTCKDPASMTHRLTTRAALRALSAQTFLDPLSHRCLIIKEAMTVTCQIFVMLIFLAPTERNLQ